MVIHMDNEMIFGSNNYDVVQKMYEDWTQCGSWVMGRKIGVRDRLRWECENEKFE